MGEAEIPASREGDHAEARRRFASRQVDRDRTLEAMLRLEEMLGAPAPRREEPWRAEVVGALAKLEAATQAEEENARQPDSLLSDIERTQMRLRSRVHGVRAQYALLREALTSLHSQISADPDPVPDVADIRERVAWVLTALRHLRARESDLLYEAYYDAFGSDLPEEGPDSLT